MVGHRWGGLYLYALGTGLRILFAARRGNLQLTAFPIHVTTEQRSRDRVA